MKTVFTSLLAFMLLCAGSIGHLQAQNMRLNPNNLKEKFLLSISKLDKQSSKAIDLYGNRSAAEELEYSTREAWDGASWNETERESYSYNANGTLATGIGSYWDGIAYQNSNKTTYSYNGGGEQLSSFSESWWNGAAWNNNYKEEYTYNSDGNKEYDYSSYWDENKSAWVNEYKSTYGYNPDKSLDTYIESVWDTIRNAYMDELRLTVTYTDGKPTLLNGEMWNPDASEWVAFATLEYSYHPNGFISESILTMGFIFVDIVKQTFKYDNLNNLIETASFSWNDIDEVWMDEAKSLVDFNTLYLAANFNMPYMGDFIDYDQGIGQDVPMHNIPTMITDYGIESGPLEQQYRTSFHYSLALGIHDEVAKTQILLYPNPACDLIQISADASFNNARFELFDLQGRMVMSELYQNKMISVAHLPQGLYSYRLYKDAAKAEGKLMIQ